MSERRHASRAEAARQQDVAAYKAMLREFINRRPSGMRQRIARALGTHRSFVTHITNPSSATAIPARHVPVILEIIHASVEERARFLHAYGAAHPGAHPGAGGDGDGARRTISIEIPVLADPAAQAALEDLIRLTAQRLAAIARMSGPETERGDKGRTTP